MSSRKSIRTHEDMENLSDGELRQRLHEKGFPSIPVTETTRKILLTKLNNESQLSPSSKRNTSRTIQRNTYNGGEQRVQSSGQKVNVQEYVLRNNDTSRQQYPQDKNWKNYKEDFYEDSDVDARLCNDSWSNGTNWKKFSEESDSDPGMRTAWQNTRNNSNSSKFNYGLDRNSNTHYGLVNRLLSFRDKTIKKPEKASASPASYTTSYRNNRYTSNISYNTNPVAYSHYYENTTQKLRRKTKQFVEYCTACTKMDMCVPYTLNTLFVVFLLVLCFMYVRKSIPLSNLVEDKSIVRLLSCQSQQEILNYGDIANSKICLDEDLIPDTITLKHGLFRLLYEHASSVKCDQPLQPITVSLSELIKAHVPNMHAMNSMDTSLMRKLLALEYLINHNPQWNITIVNNEGVIPSFLHLDTYRLPRANEWIFVLTRRDYPLMCVLYRKIHRFFAIIGTSAIVGLLVLSLYWICTYIYRIMSKRSQLTKYYMQKITDRLQCQAAICENDVEKRKVIINHLRDTLIPSHKFKQRWSYWESAVKMLINKDSRIQCGTTLINGEEFVTLAWIEAIDSDTAENCLKTKKWQSPAFDNINVVTSPPTPCLKIRNMFDSSEASNPRIKEIIEEAVLEKVSPNCRIKEIQLDKESCCVYIYCESQNDAGIVHRMINGWWFDKRLLSVKFVRLQRYLTRFPNRILMTPPLDPI